ncbi:hypothetical protein ACU8KH_05828 [Lachancea thermotolerans]
MALVSTNECELFLFEELVTSGAAWLILYHEIPLKFHQLSL